MPDVPPNPPPGTNHDENANHKIEPMEQSFQPGVLVPLLAQYLSHISQSQTPGQRTRESVNDELFYVHPRHARRKGDEGTNHGQKAARENNDFSESTKPAIGEVQIVMG